MVTGGYVVEGHVPADLIDKLVAARPSDVIGLAVPGMVVGSPGMEGPNAPPYKVFAVKRNTVSYEIAGTWTLAEGKELYLKESEA